MDRLTDEIATRILAEIARAERSKAQVARLTGIPEATFRRKLAGHGDFTVPELARVARALNVEPASLLPTGITASAMKEPAA